MNIVLGYNRFYLFWMHNVVRSMERAEHPEATRRF